MSEVTTRLTVEWEDCDPAGIIFYPRFFNYFDRGSWNLYYSKGLTREAMREEFGGMGFPAMDASANFTYPCRFKDELILVTAVAEFNEKTLIISHTIHNGAHVAVTGREVRFWGIPHPTDPNRLMAAPIPQGVIDRLKG